MLLALLLALIFGFGGESEFASSIPHIKKEIRQHVPDEARNDSLLVLVKDYEKTIKKYDKEKKKLLKKVDRAGADREVSTEVFLQTYDDYYQARMNLISELIGYRLMFQEQLDPYELLGITENALSTSKKEKRKGEKLEGKTEKKLSKVFLDINEIILKHIDDSTKTELVTKSLQEFETTIYAYVDEARDLIVERKVMINKQDASREDIEDMYQRSNLLRYKASRDFAALRDDIIKNTDEREWKAINKELKVFLKS